LCHAFAFPHNKQSAGVRDAAAAGAAFRSQAKKITKAKGLKGGINAALCNRHGNDKNRNYAVKKPTTRKRC
jgi:hypothetical protein